MRIALSHFCRRRRAIVLAAAACGALLTGCTTHSVPPITPALVAAARSFKTYTVYWAGLDVDGARLTAADSPLEFGLYSPVGFTMLYGNCEGRGTLRDGGCTLPLKITTTIYTAHSDASFGPQHWLQIHGVPAVIYHGGDDIEIYTDRQYIDIVADSPARAMAAADALEPFNRTPSSYWPAFPQPAYTPNPPEVNGSTATTGPIGATTAIAPPDVLEPAPPQ